MAARAGMTELISELRSLVDDPGTVAFTDDRLQQIMDRNRLEFWQEQILPNIQYISGTARYLNYESAHANLEGTASGSAAFRLYASVGADITTGFTLDGIRGLVAFDTDQAGSVRYMDGRSYDLYGAAGDAWTERMGKVSSSYDVSLENRSFSRSQWFDHCSQMANHYNSLRTGFGVKGDGNWVEYERGDYLP